MTKSTTKATTGRKPPAKSTTSKPSNYKSLSVSDDEDYPSLDNLPKYIRLANAYAEYLDPDNKNRLGDYS
jgi:hypothetical protein